MDALLIQSPAAAYISDNLGDDLFTLIDVGCSGGHMPGWRALGAHLRAFGFDPQRYEIARLRAEETNPLVEYIEGYVGAPDDHPLHTLPRNDHYWCRSGWVRWAPFRSAAIGRGEAPPNPTIFIGGDEATPELTLPPLGNPKPMKPMEREARHASPAVSSERLTDVDACEAARQADLRERNLWLEADLTAPTRTIVLPEFLRDRGVSDIDFLKIDVDGPDYEILYTMSDALQDAQILGANIEVNFSGSHRPHQHTFHVVDRFMKAHGFTLFALTVRTYSSAALPQPYLMPHPAQATKGQPFQGDAIYIRDFGMPLPECDPQMVSDYKLAKTAILFAMFDLPAEAVEHLQRFRDRLSRLFDVDQAIELLTQEAQRKEQTNWSYAEYMAAFDAQHPYFFDRLVAPEFDLKTGMGSHPTDIAQAVGREAQAEAAVARVRAEEAERRLAEVQAELARLKAFRKPSTLARLFGAAR